MRTIIGELNCPKHGECELEERFERRGDMWTYVYYAWCPGCEGVCKVCGHRNHEPGKCHDWGIVPDCRCLCCNGGCTCDGQSWEYDDGWEKRKGGRYTTPERK